MAETYQNVGRVLVLDRGIQRLSSATTKYEACLQILTSSWPQRTWTLQEGTLPTENHFVLSDGIMTGKDIVSVIYNSDQSVPEILLADLQRLYSGIILPSGGDHKTRLRFVWQALQWRSTSQKDDETLCIATLLGLDPSLLVDVPPHLRMQELFSMRNKWPADVIFYPGERVAETGRRWIPDSFFERQVYWFLDRHTGVSSSEGLRLHGWSYPCFIISGFKLKQAYGASYMVCEASRAAYFLTLQSSAQFLDNSEDDKDEPIHCGLILRTSVVPYQATLAVLCRIDKQEAAVIFATYPVLLTCYRLGPEKFTAMRDQMRNGDDNYFLVESAPHDAEWVIGYELQQSRKQLPVTV